MQNFTGRITNIMPVTERGEWKSVQFVVQNTEGQYPETCVFTKSAKGDNQKYVDGFEGANPIGSLVSVDYTFKSREYNGKWYTDIVSFKTTVLKKAESVGTVPQEQLNKVADVNGLVQEPLHGDESDDLPF